MTVDKGEKIQTSCHVENAELKVITVERDVSV